MTETTESPLYKPNPIRMEFIEFGYIEPEKIDREFILQRPIENSRLKIIANSMSKIGYDHAHPVVLSEAWKAVDGNHRIHLSLKNKYKQIPYVRYKFEDDLSACEYFKIAQVQTQGMKARDELYAYFQSGHPYALLLYNVCEMKKRSLLRGCHDLKVEPSCKSMHSNVKVETICYIINRVVLGIKNGWARGSEARLATLSIPWLASNQDLDIAVSKTNDFLKFFFDSFGSDTGRGELKFREHFLKAVMDIFIEYLLPHPMFASDRLEVIKKLNKVRVTKELVTNHRDAIIGILLKKINGTRTKKERLYC